ncbi:PadR family transcriptional regulator [Rhizobium herbae]|uniref:DNA-binding PadR family transcriptional regulator n=1 Tax=Rhizobium herbae TaxID=508661 RepID=A0ABS4ESR4_9HYPH|nr:PadR family transcriptional regulator [Rhizobium herbae]MBP1860975.1 DNA-binding PadR family transcriptional regulator [Rhizobium herbae]
MRGRHGGHHGHPNHAHPSHDGSCRERHAHGRHGPGRFEGGFASPGGFRAGRKLSSGDLQLLILALLARQPAHGYELIRTIEELSGGFYVPSPGMIYPALTYLDEIGHATAEADGNKKLFSMTDAGRAALEADRAGADRIIEGLGRIGSKMDAVRDVIEGRGPPSGEDPEAHGHHALEIARQAIKASLFHKRGCSPQEATRLADILRRAVEEINRG